MAESNSKPSAPELPASESQQTKGAESNTAVNDIIVHDAEFATEPSVHDVGLSAPADLTGDPATITGAEKLEFAHVFESETSGNLDQYLSFTWDGAQTTVGVSGPGGGVEQKIVLQGIDLTSIGDGSAGAIISALLADSNKPI